MAENNITATRESLIAEIQRRVDDKILEQTNADLLTKLIRNADTLDEAMAIAQLGTTYKRTGLHYDKRLEKQRGNTIKYFKKNEQLSFTDGSDSPHHKLIIGDNYDALQNLLIQYRGKVDVIYIDPPYGKDSMGEFAQTNYDNAITRDNLLSMLQPRLELAKQLLSDTGVIFCSIDDKNQAYIKCLFDEVFSEVNFSGTILWQKKQKPSFLSANFGTMYEYVLCYVKNHSNTYPFSLETTTLGKKYPFNNAGNSVGILTFRPHTVTFNLPDCLVKKQDMSEGNIITELLDDVQIVDGTNTNEFRLKGEFRYSQDSVNQFMDDSDVIYISKVPFRPNLVKKGGEIKKMRNLLSQDSYRCETNEHATEQLEQVLGSNPFDNPKPVGLIQKLILATTYDKKESVILDFFAGSGTTGQSVLAQNKNDLGQRQYLLCQVNEITEKNPHGIALDVTAPRLKRIMTGSCYSKSTRYPFYTGCNDFPWLKDNEPYGGSLNVYEIESVSNAEHVCGKTPFDVIDETLYGKEKFDNLEDKIRWVCENFEVTQDKLVEKK